MHIHPWYRRPLVVTIAVVAILGMVFLSGLGVASLMDRGDRAPSVAAGSPSTTAPASVGVAETPTGGPVQQVSDSVCGLPDGDMDTVDLDMSDVTWIPKWGTYVPVSDTYGPVNRDGEIASCWQHSAEGAVVAATWQMLASSYSPEWVGRHMPPGPQRDKVVRRIRSTPDPEPVSVQGHKIVSATKDSMRVTLAVGSPKISKYLTVEVTVEWREGDWRMRYEDLGGGEVSTLSDFQRWQN